MQTSNRIILALRFRAILMALSLMALSEIPHTTADIVKLKNGGEVRGTLVGSNARRNKNDTTSVRIETIRGTVVEIERKDIEFVSRRRLEIEIYEILAAKTLDTVEEQWKFANWCRQNKMQSQSEKHLRKVIALDPNHAKARRSLGYQPVANGWMTRDEIFRSQGLVKYKGKYITPEELEILSKTKDVRDREKNWYKKIYRLVKNLTNNNFKNAPEAKYQLLAIKDQHAIPALTTLLSDRKENAMRMLYVQILGRIPRVETIPPLATQSLFDREKSIREFAFRSITTERHREALPYFIKGLKNPDNRIVLRAGIKLEQMQLEQSIPALIEALTTYHDFYVEVLADRKRSFNTDGTSGQKSILQQLPPDIVQGLRNGRYPYGVGLHNFGAQTKPSTKIVTVKLEVRNKEVLSALRKLTGENFNFDKRTWSIWHEANKVGFLKKKNSR